MNGQQTIDMLEADIRGAALHRSTASMGEQMMFVGGERGEGGTLIGRPLPGVRREQPSPSTSIELARVIEQLKAGEVPPIIDGVSTLVENQAMLTAESMERNAAALHARADQLEKGAAALRTRTMNALQDLRDAVAYERQAFQLTSAAILSSDEMAMEPRD